MQEEWRIQMLPIDFLFLTVKPVVDMRLRCKQGGTNYPPEVPLDVRKILELSIVSSSYSYFIPKHILKAFVFRSDGS